MIEVNTLLNCVEQYLAMRQIDKKKYLPSYLISAKFAWQHLFRNTIYAVNSEWVTVKAGTPYNYVDMPKNCDRFFSASVVGFDGRIQELFYDNLLNIIEQPLSSERKCGCCGSCGCGGLCDDMNSLTYTTKVLFTINGIDYIEKDWIKVCPNGDIIEYREIPTKKYNDFAGDSGDHMHDYNLDYNIGNPPFSNFTIKTVTEQKIICSIALKPCGCPVDTPENIDTINTYCGCYLPINAYCKTNRGHRQKFLGEINSDCRGRVKMSDCGTKLYFIPDSNGSKGHPEFLLLNWQTSGVNCGVGVQVPDYALDAMFSGIHYYSVRFNSSYPQNEKEAAKYNFRNAENEIIMYLNPLSLKRMSEIQDSVIRF